MEDTKFRYQDTKVRWKCGDAGSDEKASGAELVKPGVEDGWVFQVVEDVEARSGGAQVVEGNVELVFRFEAGEGQAETATAVDELGSDFLIGLQPVQALKEAAIAVAEFDGELGFAKAAHAGEGDTGVGADVLGEVEQVGSAAGEEDVAGKVEAPAREPVAWFGEGVR